MLSVHATNTYCDNQSVVQNTTLLESNLNNNIILVEYRYVRCAVSENIITMQFIDTKNNLLGNFTYSLTNNLIDCLFLNGNIEQTVSSSILVCGYQV